MTAFYNLKILTKILSLLGLLSLLTVGSALYAGSQMRAIDRADTAIIDGPDKANIAIARGNRNVMAWGLAFASIGIFGALSPLARFVAARRGRG